MTDIAIAEFHVPHINCGHCVAAIDKALRPQPGVAEVGVDLKTKMVTVHYDPGRLDRDRIVDAIEDCGYSVEKLPEGSSP